MREVLTIIGKEKNMKHHYCLEGIDLDNIPFSRVGESIKRLRQCTDKVNMSITNIRPELMKKNPDILYRSATSGHEVFYTWPKDNDDYVIYRVDKLMDNEVWGIGEQGNMEYIIRYDDKADLKDINEYNNYCEGYAEAVVSTTEESVKDLVNER